MNWAVDKLKGQGFNAIAPDLSTPWIPQYEEWKKEFERYPVTEKSLLVGHSCGGTFLVRWLLDTGQKVKKLILVAPAKIPETEDDTRKELYNFELPADASHIAREIVLFTSNDFPHHLKSLPLYVNSLKPRVIKMENKGHFLYFQMKTNEFPELIEEIVNS